MLPRRVMFAILGLWLVLAVPGVALWGHECHGLVGFLAHTPLYAFQGLTAAVAVIAVAATIRRART